MFFYPWDAFEEGKDYGTRTVSSDFVCGRINFLQQYAGIFSPSHAEAVSSNNLLLISPHFQLSNSSGIKRRRHCHIRLVLREIDFPTKLLEAGSINQKRKWLGLLRNARDDYAKASADREELVELEAMAAQLEEEAKKKKEEEEK